MRSVVVVPAFSHIEPECEAALRALERDGLTVWRRFGCSAIDKARSMLACEALSAGYERLLWVDADIAFRPEDAKSLIDAPHPLCCGAYATKKPGGSLTVDPINPAGLTFGEGGGWAEVRATGFGFVAVSSFVFRNLDALVPEALDDHGRPHRPYFMPMLVVRDGRAIPQYLAEDFSFCYRARSTAHRIWCDTRIRLYHVGRYLYSWEDTVLSVPRAATVRSGGTGAGAGGHE